MGSNRRDFLQKTGLALLTMGLGVDKFSLMTQSHLQTLAQSTPRKLALLVGINQYNQNSPLKGCVTDVELQRELLINRFGFQSGDILTLTNQQATREGIETAFMEHLIQQAKDGDVVVFHFSGYGSQVLDPHSLGLINSLVPVDGILPTKGDSALNDILEDTLILLGRSLPTSAVSMILDTSYQNRDKILEGNFRLRVCQKLPSKKYPNPEELAFKDQLKSKIKELQNRQILSNSVPFLGTILNGAGGSNTSLEGSFNGFNAGLFTYSLTQFLWEITLPSTLYFGLQKVTEKMTHLLDIPQQPFILRTGKQPQWFYSLLPQKDTAGIGVITGLEDEGKTVILKLLGLPYTVIDNYGNNSLVNVNLPEIDTPIILQIKSKEGLGAKAKIIEPQNLPKDKLKIGQVVTENLRVLSSHQGLIVALDNNLPRIEKVDATSTFANIAMVTSVVNQGEWADCIFSKNLPDENENTVSGYTLSSGAGIPLKTINNETVKSAIQKIADNFELLLAKKLWNLLENEHTSALKVEGVLDVIKPKKQLLLKKETGKSLSPNIITPHLPQQPLKDTVIPHLTKDNEIQYRFQNNSDRPLYFILLGLDDQQPIIFSTFMPNQSVNQSIIKESPIIQKIEAGETLNLPIFKISENYNLSQKKKLVSLQAVFCDAPFYQTSKAFSNINKGGLIPLNNPLEIAKGILQDINDASQINLEKVNLTADFYGLNVNNWASFNFIYQV
jgi:hypothetical protein